MVIGGTDQRRPRHPTTSPRSTGRPRPGRTSRRCSSHAGTRPATTLADGRVLVTSGYDQKRHRPGDDRRRCTTPPPTPGRADRSATSSPCTRSSTSCPTARVLGPGPRRSRRHQGAQRRHADVARRSTAGSSTAAASSTTRQQVHQGGVRGGDGDSGPSAEHGLHARHEPAEPDLATDQLDGLPAQLRQPHEPAGRHRAGHRRRHREVRLQSTPTACCRRELEPRDGELENAGQDDRGPALPLGGGAAARRPRVRGRRRRDRGDRPQVARRSYSPPYLFKGARPTISSAPATVQYGAARSSPHPTPARSRRVSLIRTGSVTHSFDQNARSTLAQFTQTAGGFNVQVPAERQHAPPGYYLLSIVNRPGRSVGRLDGPLPGALRGQPGADGGDRPGRRAASSPTQVGLSWSPSSDNVGLSATTSCATESG